MTKTSLNVGLIPSAGASTGRGVAGSSGLQNAGSAEPSSEAYLDTFQEELQKKVDTEVGVLVDGLQECVQLAKVSETCATLAFEAKQEHKEHITDQRLSYAGRH